MTETKTPIKLKEVTCPQGFYYVPNFLTSEEAKAFLDDLRTGTSSQKWVGVSSNPKSRRVIQYGYTYSYTSQKPLEATNPLPDMYAQLANKWATSATLPTQELKDLLTGWKPTQLIINEYLSGQGINAHTDHTRQFGAIVVCLTLGSGTEIEFTRDGYDPFRVYVEPNSLYVMSGDARYRWKHAIAPRKTDCVNGHTKTRKTRISLTFRTIT